MLIGYSPDAGVFLLYGGAVTRTILSPPPLMRALLASACVWLVPGTWEDDL